MSHSQKVRVASCTVLIVDDERNIRNTLSMCLEAMGCHVLTASNGDEAIHHAQKSLLDVAFLDLRLAHEDGLQLLPRLLAERPALQVVVVTAFATLDTAVEAMRRGAQDYLPKPFTPDQVRHVLHLLQERSSLRRRVTELEDELQRTVPNVEMQVRSRSARMQHVLGVLERAAPSDACIMLKGESGTGKSLLARVVHEKSARATRPFVTVNCPTLTEDLLASELFGHARGSFTGALKDQPGRVESADGGTLFLDEIGELPGSLQAKLLRFVQDKEFERVGENRTRRADVRVLAATNRNLEADVRSGRFREDLYYRLNVV
jgi:NtrC-family two-component system response regulator AlgB